MGVGISEKNGGITDSDKKGGDNQECCIGEMARGPEQMQKTVGGKTGEALCWFHG